MDLVSSRRSNCIVAQQCVLRERQLSFDPHLHQQTFRKRLYSQPSFVKRFEIEKRLENHNGCVNCINFSESGNLLASGSDDLQIMLWDWAKGSPVSSFNSKHVANVFQAKFMPQTNDSVIVSSARDGQVRCHVLSSTGDLMSTQRVSYHNESAHKLALEPDNPHVFLSCGEDSNVMEIDLRTDNSQRNKLISVRDIKKNRIALYSVFINPSNYNLFAVSGRDEFARVYDRRVLSESKVSEDTGPIYHEPMDMYCPTRLVMNESQHNGTHMTCLAYSHDGKELLCSYNDEDIYTFDTTVPSESQDYSKCFEGHRNSATVKGVNYFGLNSEYIVSGSDCGHVFLWDKNTTEIVQYLKGDFEGVVNCLEPHPHIPVLAVSGLDHDIKLISPLREINSDLEGLAEVVETNAKRRKEDSEYSSMDGYDVILSFIMRQYRRGLRRRAGIESDDEDSILSDSEDQDMTEDEDNGDNEEEEGEELPARGVGGHRRRRQRRSHDNENEDDEDDDDDSRVQCIQS